jgi:oxygen-independent coproporphyrinogen-3 oxidase
MDIETYIYIHIPFCIRKCNYCSFVSFPIDNKKTDLYIARLLVEINHQLIKSPLQNLKSIYIGGGTPSVLSIEQLEKILKSFPDIPKLKPFEFTFEVNPATAGGEYFEFLKQAGVNRISVGVQSFDEDTLKRLGRPHKVKDIYMTLENIKKAGIDNINIDLISALPLQTLAQWNKTLEQAIDCKVNHVSVYSLKIEEGTPFERMYSQEHPDLPDDTQAAEMFQLTHEKLTRAGYRHYEISNYAQPGFESLHNINYWKNKEYLGFGLAAHSFRNRTRYENYRDLEQYCDDPIGFQTIHPVSREEYIEDTIFLGLRMTEGIDLKAFEAEFERDFLDFYQPIISRYREYFCVKNDRFFFTQQGLLISNSILADFITAANI